MRATSPSVPNRTFLSRLSSWTTGLIKIPVFGTVSILRSLTKVPGHMAAGLKEGRLGALLDPFKAVVDVAWNAVTLVAAGLNHATAPVYGLFDPAQGPGEVRYSDGMVWTSGGVAGGIIHALERPRFRYFMPSNALLFADKAQVDCDCNPANPGDPYDTNAVNALHEVILRDRRPVGYATDFAAPWAFSKSFRRREEASALQEAIDRLYPSP